MTQVTFATREAHSNYAKTLLRTSEQLYSLKSRAQELSNDIWYAYITHYSPGSTLFQWKYGHKFAYLILVCSGRPWATAVFFLVFHLKMIFYFCQAPICTPKTSLKHLSYMEAKLLPTQLCLQTFISLFSSQYTSKPVTLSDKSVLRQYSDRKGQWGQ